MSNTQSNTVISPITKTVTVELSVDAAFRRFTEEIASWWPMATHSVGEEKTESVTLEGFVGGRFYERQKDARTETWGTVTEWDPPHRVGFTWHPGRDPESAQRVEVEFAPSDGKTVVTLLHHDWDVFGEEAEKMRGRYDGGWDGVLKLFVG